jgi:hypothetical protein
MLHHYRILQNPSMDGSAVVLPFMMPLLARNSGSILAWPPKSLISKQVSQKKIDNSVTEKINTGEAVVTVPSRIDEVG